MKKTKIKVRGLIVIFCILMLTLLITPTKVHAVLQSNGDSETKKTINDWMLQIRKMQEAGGTLGLSDTIDTTNLTSGNTNLDIHMEKNTEYGAMALLSASSYGKPDKVNDSETTTGNASGVVIKLNDELVSGGTISSSQTYVNAANRYKNIYTTEYQPRSGDAITETAGWYGGSSTWLYRGWREKPHPDDCGVILRGSGSIFGYYGRTSYLDFYAYDDKALYTNPLYTRAVIVVGSGV